MENETKTCTLCMKCKGNNECMQNDKIDLTKRVHVIQRPQAEFFDGLRDKHAIAGLDGADD